MREKSPRLRLYRGEYAGVWERRLLKAGWPADFAKQMSEFLVGDLRPTPPWPLAKFDELVAAPFARRIVEP